MKLLRIFPALVVVALSFIVTSCDDSANDPSDRVTIPENAPDDESWKATILFTDSLGSKARLRVGHARRYTATMETILDSGVYIEFFGSDGSINATLVADSARIDDRTKDMKAFGRVHVVSPRERTEVDTDRLFWDAKDRKLRSDSHVKLDNKAKDEQIQGSGFESDESLHNYTIFNVTGRTHGGG